MKKLSDLRKIYIVEFKKGKKNYMDVKARFPIHKSERRLPDNLNEIYAKCDWKLDGTNLKFYGENDLRAWAIEIARGIGKLKLIKQKDEERWHPLTHEVDKIPIYYQKCLSCGKETEDCVKQEICSKCANIKEHWMDKFGITEEDLR